MRVDTLWYTTYYGWWQRAREKKNNFFPSNFVGVIHYTNGNERSSVAYNPTIQTTTEPPTHVTAYNVLHQRSAWNWSSTCCRVVQRDAIAVGFVVVCCEWEVAKSGNHMVKWNRTLLRSFENKLKTENGSATNFRIFHSLSPSRRWSGDEVKVTFQSIFMRTKWKKCGEKYK